MEAERWRAAKRGFQEVLARPLAEREAQLAACSAGDPALRAEIVALLAAHDAAGERFESSPLGGLAALLRAELDDDAPSPQVGPFRVLRRLGRGGMGTVYLAVRDDDELGQPVAVKVITRGMGSAAIVRRFHSERKILASLRHPNIARVHEGGTSADGLPYFVMEHVEGEPLDAYCVHRQLSTEQRLRLFCEVCAAVHFAHQNLVVHRDLKPSNVLVTRDGVPKLLDFGIAKLLESQPGTAEHEPLTVDRPMTPGYASPEQVRGEAVTTAADVYSLGVVLHVLLTGALPPERPPAGPRGDLDNIVSLALHPEPARRYASAERLAEDVRRHLDGFPVRARPDSLGYRARKFVGRHRLAVGLSALGVLALLAATGLALWQAHVAREQRARAERRFADVRRLANVVLFDVHAALDNVSGGMAARRLLVETALRYLDDLAGEAADEPALLVELATAYERVGEVQGMPGWPSAGRTGDALASFERALALRRRARAGSGARSGADAAEARLLLRIGSVLAARGDTAAALARHREALAALERQVAAAPTTALRLQLAQAHVAVGDDRWELGDVPAAAESYRRAQVVAQAARAGDAGSAEATRQVGVVAQRLGDAAAESGDYALALEHHGASLAVDRALIALRDDDPEARRDLGTDLSRMGNDYAELGRTREALTQHQEALRLREALLAAEPADARALEDAAESHLHVGRTLATLQRRGEAIAECALAIELWERLLARDPHNARWQDVLAEGLTTLAGIELDRGERQAAERSLARAGEVRRALAAASPDFAGNRDALATVEGTLARLRAGDATRELAAALAPWR